MMIVPAAHICPHIRPYTDIKDVIDAGRVCALTLVRTNAKKYSFHERMIL